MLHVKRQYRQNIPVRHLMKTISHIVNLAVWCLENTYLQSGCWLKFVSLMQCLHAITHFPLSVYNTCLPQAWISLLSAAQECVRTAVINLRTETETVQSLWRNENHNVIFFDRAVVPCLRMLQQGSCWCLDCTVSDCLSAPLCLLNEIKYNVLQVICNIYSLNSLSFYSFQAGPKHFCPWIRIKQKDQSGGAWWLNA